MAKPLHRLTEKNAAFTWTDACQHAFDELRKCLTTSPILAYPDAAVAGAVTDMHFQTCSTEEMRHLQSQSHAGPNHWASLNAIRDGSEGSLLPMS